MSTGTRLKTLSRFGTECLLIATLTPYLHDWWWAFELPAHFHPHIAAAAALTVLLALALRQRTVMSLAVASLLNSGVAMYSVPTRLSAGDSGISVLSQNLSYGNPSFDEFLNIVVREVPDIVVLLEYTPEWEAAMDRLAGEYISRITAPDSGAFGIAMFSKLPLESHELLHLGQSKVPAIAARFESSEFDGTLVAVHLNPPIGSTWSTDRNLQLSELRDYLLALDHPFVAAGDFNNTPWSPTFRSFVMETDWHIARPSMLATWPAMAGRFGIPIDLAVASAEISLGNKGTLDLPGSDHRGIRIDISNRAGASGGSAGPGSQ